MDRCEGQVSWTGQLPSSSLFWQVWLPDQAHSLCLLSPASLMGAQPEI